MTVLPNEFIEEMKIKLTQEKTLLAHRNQELKAQDPFHDPDHSNDNAAIDKDASEESDHDRVTAIVEEVELQLTAIDAALERISQGTYGVCLNCGKPIDEDRLKVFPTADKCVECENLSNRT